MMKFAIIIDNIFNNIRMNKNQKLLPHLDQLFLRRQSYSFHRKHILEIRAKKPRIFARQSLSPLISHRSSNSNSIHESKVSKNNPTNKSHIDPLPPTILQRCYSLRNSIQWMSPYRKRRFMDQLKQNQRIRDRISTSKSDLRKNKLEKDYEKFAKIKERLMKYEVNPESHKAMLKSQKSLNSLSLTPKTNNGLKLEQAKKIEQPKKIEFRNKKYFDYSDYKNRRQSNQSAFVKKTYQMDEPNENPNFLAQNKTIMKKQEGHLKTQKNTKYYERLKTEINRKRGKVTKLNTKINSQQSFSITEIDI